MNGLPIGDCRLRIEKPSLQWRKQIPFFEGGVGGCPTDNRTWHKTTWISRRSRRSAILVGSLDFDWPAITNPPCGVIKWGLDRSWFSIGNLQSTIGNRKTSIRNRNYPVCRRASVIGMREALKAGKTELKMPMAKATTRLINTTTGGIGKPNWRKGRDSRLTPWETP